jgi:hypothetical protein
VPTQRRRRRTGSAPLAVVDSRPRPTTRRVDLSARQEFTRAALAIVAAAIFLVTLIGALVLANGPHWDNAKELLQIFLPVEATLLGGAGAFYFATER